MLGAITPERLQLLSDLRRSHQVFILSNTNSIHERAFNAILQHTSGKPSLHHVADRVYFSHEMHMRKPDVEIYQQVLAQSGAHPAETLFMDDKPANLQGATQAGISTLHITTPNDILGLRKYVG